MDVMPDEELFFSKKRKK